MSDRDERIRQRAYDIWDREGRPDGREAEHWDRALEEIGREDGTAAPGQPDHPDGGGTADTPDDGSPDGDALLADVDPERMERDLGHGAEPPVARSARHTGIGNPLAEEPSEEPRSAGQPAGEGGRHAAADRPPTGEGAAPRDREGPGAEAAGSTEPAAGDNDTGVSDALPPPRGVRPGRGRRGTSR